MPTKYDVFVSHTWADGDRPREIVDALKTAGLRVWFDENETKDFESITHTVEQGLAKSKVLLAYYSKTYPTRRACQWELTAAFIAAQREGDPRHRILVVNPESGSGHIQPIELRDAKFLTGLALGDGAALNILAEAVRRHVADLEQPFGEVQPLAPPQWYGMRGVGSTRFVGRLDEMWLVHSLLHAGDVAMITGRVGSGGVAQVRGIGGIGKSLLAEEYAMRFGAAYPGGVFWLRAYGNDDAKIGMGQLEREAERERQIREFAARLALDVTGKTPDEVEGVLAHDIERRGKVCLWVVDDVPGGLDGQALRRWFAPHSLARTLVTTRSREYGAQASGVDLSVLTPDDAYQLLTWQRSPDGSEEEERARGIAENLGWHSLALDVAGAALASFGGDAPFRDFSAELARPDTDSLELATDLADALPNGHERSIAQTLLRSIRNLGAEARDFLRLASVLAVAPIPSALVAAILERVDRLNRQTAKWRTRRAFHEVTISSLAELAGAKGDALAVHTLVSRAMQFHDHEQERIEVLRAAAIAALILVLCDALEDPLLQIEFHAIHAREMASRPAAVSLSEVDLLRCIASYDHKRGAYASAAALYSREHALLWWALGSEHPQTLRAAHNLAGTLWLKRDFQRARTILENTLATQRRVLGLQHPDTLMSMNGLGLTLRAQGDLEAACRLQEETLAIQRRYLGPQHPHTLASMNNLAGTLDARGELSQARKLYEEALALFRQVHGPDHPNTLQLVSNLAETLWHQGDLEEARKLGGEALDRRRQLLGPEHPSTSISAWTVFRILQDLSDRKGARAVLKRDLVWLLDRDSNTLGVDQREIRDWVAEAIQSDPKLTTAPPLKTC